MAFTGTPAVDRINDRIFLITGCSFAGAATGTITVGTGAGEIDLGETDWRATTEATLAARVSCWVVPAASVAAADAACYVTKAGTTVDDLVITVGSATATGALEIWVELL